MEYYSLFTNSNHAKNIVMNKSDLINSIAENASLTKAQATGALNAFLDAVEGALKDGDKVTLVGFGTFSAEYRNARTGRNPRTREEIPIPAKVVAKFKAGKDLSELVNNKKLLKKLKK